MEKQFGKDLTTGDIPRHLLLFSLPMLLGNAMQIGYGIINTIWVGHLVGENAVGAVGVSFPVVYVAIGITMGMSMAATIVVAQFYGAKQYAMLEKAVGTSYSLALMLGAAMTIAGVLWCDPLLRLMKTPPENFAMASVYLRITFAGMILFYLGFLTNYILRGIGDTVTPLIFMSIGLGLNAIIDPFFIGGWGPFPRFGLEGAACASLVSQAVGLGACLVYLNRSQHVIALSPGRLNLDGRMVLLLFKIGLPSMIQQSLVSIGSLVVVTFVNSFGSEATNAFGATARVDMVTYMPALSMSIAAAALTGQNLGAGRTERVKEVFKWGVLMTSSITILISLVAVLLSKLIMRMFGVGDDATMGIGVSYLHIVGGCYIFFAIMFISNGVINGAGHTITTMALSLLSLWLVRVPAAWLLSRTGLGIKGIWVAIVLSSIVSMAASLGYYFSGRWKKSTIIKRTPTPAFAE